MNHLYTIDTQGACHVSDQGVIELAYQDLLDNSMFEWQNAHSKQQYKKVSEYLDCWPMQIHDPAPSDRHWFTPSPYDQINLRSHVLSRCANEQEIQRADQELCIIEHIRAEHIFKHLIYLVDTWRSQGMVWGVGRGSSVSCFVLYVIGVNRINPLDYDLPLTEFFKLTEQDILNICKNKVTQSHG
jgi:DNA polymerase III alpha subunit